MENQLSPYEKVLLFKSLFKGRTDVYAVRWESKNSKSGYAPAYGNRKYTRLSEQVIYDHLSGKHTVGIYPLLKDNTCWLLAVDFDKKQWQVDVSAFLNTCKDMKVPVSVERSRSGNGCHVWIFFDTAIPASLARQLGFVLLSHTLERRYQARLESYDRLFPSQDILPDGGFGNLIALPLQQHPRTKGYSVFVDDDFKPFPDQWLLLSNVKKMSINDVQNLVHQFSQVESNIKQKPGNIKQASNFGIAMPTEIKVICKNGLLINKKGLPASLINQLNQLGSLNNPEFYRKQSNRLSTHGTPRVINCVDDYPSHLILPRGCWDDLKKMLKEYSVEIVVSDEQNPGKTIDVTFKGELRPQQEEAVIELLKHDKAVLSATTGFGKNQAKVRPFEHLLIPRYTNFKSSLTSSSHKKIQYIYVELMNDDKRNNLIFDDVLKALDEGRSPIVLTERVDHIDELKRKFNNFVKNLVVLTGGKSKKVEKEALKKLENVPDNEERLIIATGKYVGEGFDDARLDTLFLVMPISWKGTLQQYVGGLHRLHDDKQVVKVYDYVDHKEDMLLKMYEKRLIGYRSLGYKTKDTKDKNQNHSEQMKLF
jgi:hypothetical protein